MANEPTRMEIDTGDPQNASGGPRFVGRTRELQALRKALADAEAGRGGLTLLAGEPGIGKTRLGEQIAQEAASRGARVLVGRCHEGDGAPSYWPWVLVLRGLARAFDPGRLATWLGAGLAIVAQVVPEVAHGADFAGTLGALDDQAARFRFFDSVATLLGRAAGERPLLVLIDDLHWADGGSLQLLHFAVRQLRDDRVLFLGTLRPFEMQAATDPEVATQLARAGRQIDLHGLAVDEVAQVMRSVLGTAPPDGLAARVHDVSAGNPFFVDALARMLAASGDPSDASDERLGALRIPDGVRAVIRTRLRPLGADARRLLTLAALLGREFSPGLVARLAPSDADQVAPALDAAERLGLVGAAGDGGRRRFVHALIVETLVGDLPALERSRLHRHAAEVLEPLVPLGLATFDEVAAHYFAAGPDGGAEKAIAYATEAARRAAARFGYEDAVRYRRRALELLDAAGDGDAERRAHLLLALGEAERRVGDADAARATLARAAAIAREAGLAEVLARAALAFGAGVGGFWEQTGGAVDDDRVVLVQQALGELGPEPSSLRALLLAHLAASLFWSTSPERRARVEPLSREAAAMAAAVDDPQTSLQVLATAHWTTWSPDGAEERLAAARALVERATEQAQPELVLRARMYVTAHHLELGDGSSADRELQRFADLASDLRQSRQAWYAHVYRGMRAYLGGRFDEVERVAAEGLALGESAQPLAARMAFGAQLTMVRREQGKVADTIASTRQVALAAPGMPVWRCALASTLADSAERSAARAELDDLVANRCALLPRDFFWLYAMAHLARACAALGVERHAATVYEILLPYADRVALAQHGVICDGAVARHLGLLAATLERWDAAIAHFDTALEVNERLAARIFVNATRWDQSCALRRRDGSGDAARADALLAAAVEGAQAAGQTALLGRIAAASGPGVVPVAPASPPAASPVDDVCSLRRAGDDWVVAHGGREFELKDTIGVKYLITLLRHPGQDVHVHDLTAGPGDPKRNATGDAGEMLDEQARRAYRGRLRQLRGDLEQAQEFHDVGMVARLQDEIEALTGELTRALGLGGRPRRASSDVERARINVTRALGRVVDAIAARDHVLGSDLQRGLHTGTYCRYTPDPRVPVRWEV